VLATQCLLQNRPKTFEVRVDGQLQPGVTAKDVILALINRIGVGGGTGYVLEYTGDTIRSYEHGRAYDGLQHVDRGWGARRYGRPR
jgi:homoaconitase/3-isopropylmalate dehydratase large subunit